MIRRGGYGLIGSMGALAMEIIVREIAAGDPRCPYNEEACRTMPIDREYMRDSGYGKTGAAILSALAAVIPSIQAEALERAAVWHDERADGERALAQAARSAGDREDAIHHAHLAAEHRASATAIRALKETT